MSYMKHHGFDDEGNPQPLPAPPAPVADDRDDPDECCESCGRYVGPGAYLCYRCVKDEDFILGND